MKIYRSLTTRRYHEKQADVPKGEKFETVEFPFAASPKAEFVDWMNEADRQSVQITGSADAYEKRGMVARLAAQTVRDIDEPLGQPQPLPAQPDPAHAARSIAMEEAWDNLPFAQKAHFASLFCEEAREKLR